MAKQKKIPDEVRQQIEAIVKRFNDEVIQDSQHFFVVRYHGAFIYLDRFRGDYVSQIGRLKYSGDLTSLEFAIYKYSREKYDPDEWFFPGKEFLNGTVEGGLKACVEAYPQSSPISILKTRGLSLLFSKLMSKFGL